jgi:hypothetical protein
MVVENSNLNLEGRESILPEVGEEGVEDTLELALSEAPEGSSRERYRYARERIFPLIEGLEDEGERGPALDDTAKKLKLAKKELREAFAAFEKDRQVQESTQHDEGRVQDDLAPEPGSERYECAMELLKDPDILARAARTMELLGHVGEQLAKMLAFVCAVSAKAGRPVQPSTHAESSTGKNYLWDTVLSLLPPELVIKRSAISDKALFRTEVDLRGAVLYLQEVAGSEGADFTIRVLQSAQYLEYEATEKMPDGSFGTVVHRKEGPVVVVQTTTEIRLYHENDTRVFPIYLDESAEQTERIVDNALRRASNGGTSQEDREGILGVWRDAIRLLEPAEVIIPYAQQIKVPSHRVRVRRDVNRLLDVIRVHAWLHQHGRERDEQGRILATEEDFHKAVELVADSLERSWKSLTPAEEAVFRAIGSLSEAKRKNGFRRNDLEVEGQDKRRVQGALKALSETGYVECEKKGGPGGYKYTVSRNLENKGLGIYLRATGDGGQEHDASQPDGDDQENPEVSEAREDENEEEEEEPYDGAENRRTGGWLLYDPKEENPLEELTELGWFRAQTDFVPEEASLEDLLDGDPVAHRLRHSIPIYGGMSPLNCVDDFDDTPLAVTSKDVFEWEARNKTEEELRSGGWPTTPEEMDAHLKRVIPLLQCRAHRFYDPGRDAWYCFETYGRYPVEVEKLCSEAYLHAELWVNEEASKEVWALTALRQNWQPPEKAIEAVVWLRVTGPDDEGGESEDLPPPDRFTF